MQRIDWKRVNVEGYPALLEAVQEIERRVCEQQLRMVELEATLAPLERMETWWFRRYVEMYGMLVELGMPGELEGPAVLEWLRRRSGGGTTGVTGDGGRCGRPAGRDGAGCLDDTLLAEVVERKNGAQGR